MKKLGEMDTRELVLFNIGETRSVKKCLTNHLAHHEKQDDRRWKIYLVLLGIIGTTIGGLVIALLAS